MKIKPGFPERRWRALALRSDCIGVNGGGTTCKSGRVYDLIYCAYSVHTHERPYTHTNAERASLKESVKVNARS